MKTVWIAQLVTAKHCLHWVKAFSAPHPTSEWAGGAQGADPTAPRDIPYYIMSYSEIKTRMLGLAGAALPRERHCPAGGGTRRFLQHLLLLGCSLCVAVSF